MPQDVTHPSGPATRDGADQSHWGAWATDDQVEHPDEGTGAPPTLDEIRDAIARQLQGAKAALADLRALRDDLHDKIREQVAEVDELERVHNQLKPRPPVRRKPKTTPAD